MNNVLKKYSLLLIVIIVAMASCTPAKKYTRSERKTSTYRSSATYSKTEHKPPSTKSTKKNSADYKVDSKRQEIVAMAKKSIGTPYKYGGKQPKTGFDCSGFTSFVFTKAGIDISGSSRDQALMGKRKTIPQLKTGDLLFFGDKSSISHVAIVAESSPNQLKVIHSTSSRGVVYEDIKGSEYWEKRMMYGIDVVD